MNGYSDSIPGNEVLEFDEAKAKELWEQAEEIQPFEGAFTISYNADGGHQEWVDALANSVSNVLGIEASGNSYPDFKSLRDEVTDRTMEGAFRTGWQSDYPSMFNFLSALYTTASAEGRGSNDGDYMKDRKSTRLNSSHVAISYAVFCLQKKIDNRTTDKMRHGQ